MPAAPSPLAGSSQTGMSAALRGDLFRLAEGLPPELLQEPGLGLLTSAIEAYMLFYPGVHCGGLHWSAPVTARSALAASASLEGGKEAV